MEQKTELNQDGLIRKVYEIPLEPHQLLDLMKHWDGTALGEMSTSALDPHLTNAGKLIDRMLETDQFPVDSMALDLWLDASITTSGVFLEKTVDHLDHAPDAETLFDALPNWHHADLDTALACFRRDPTCRMRLIICRSEDGVTASLVVIQKPDSLKDEKEDRLSVKWVKTTWSKNLGEFFGDFCNLTPAELSVFQLMVSGLSFREIETELQKSRETIRSQAKSIYAKLSVAGREDAVRLAMQVPFFLPNLPPLRPAPVARAGTKVLDVEGRQIAVVTKGDPNGRPFLFLHGVLTGHALGMAFEKCLKEANLCMICVERPGYGRSGDPQSVKTIIEEWVSIFPALLQALSLERCCLVSHASGAAYAACTLAEHPHLAPRGIGISANAPDLSEHLHSGYSSLHKFVYWCMRNSVASAEFLFKAYLAYRKQNQSVEQLIQATYGSCAPDRLALENSDNLACVVKGYQMFERPELRGVRGDLYALWQSRERWAQLLEPEHHNVHFHHVWGGQDPAIRFAENKTYCETYPFASWSTIEDAGHLMYLTHPKPLVDRIRLMVDNDAAWNRR